MAKFSVKQLAKRLNEVRAESGVKEPPPCTCEPISMGCHCGRFQWEMTQKDEVEPRRRNYVLEPEEGKAYIISRPPDSDIDYGEVPFRVWAQCEGKWAEVDMIEEDQNVPGSFWCWCDVSHITKRPGDEYWFPNDGLLLR